MAHLSPTRIVFMTPLYFGIAHVPHLYEFRLTHPETPLVLAIFRTVVQFSYTTVFGWLATFIYLRTGSLPAVILVHSFCNACGLPRLWGRVGQSVPIHRPALRPKRDADPATFEPAYKSLGVKWTVAYYVLLLAGVCAFYVELWPLTESSRQLASFS
jgi:prenyl protein peptidase